MSLNPSPRPPLSEAIASGPFESVERSSAKPAPAEAPPAVEGLVGYRRLLPVNWDRYLVRIGALLVAALGWHLASTYGFDFFVRFDNVPGPLVVGAEFLAQASSQEILSTPRMRLFTRAGMPWASAYARLDKTRRPCPALIRRYVKSPRSILPWNHSIVKVKLFANSAGVKRQSGFTIRF